MAGLNMIEESRIQTEFDKDLRNQVRLERSVEVMLVQCLRLINKHWPTPMPMVSALHEELKYLKRMIYIAQLPDNDRLRYRHLIDESTASSDSIPSTIDLVSSDDEPVPQPNWQVRRG